MLKKICLLTSLAFLFSAFISGAISMVSLLAVSAAEIMGLCHCLGFLGEFANESFVFFFVFGFAAIVSSCCSMAFKHWA